MSSSIFAANEPALGYLYQIRYGLMLGLVDTNDESKLLIEKLDDISIESSNGLSVYQTKFHLKSVANLTNASPDLWKTIRVWCEGIKNGTLDVNTSIFTIITTASASAGTIPHKLREDINSVRNINEIREELLKVANTSTNTTTNSKGYTAFKDLSEDQQNRLIQRISVIDSSINFSETKTKILEQLRLSTLKTEALYERLEGWFIGEVVLQLLNARNEITTKEIRLKVIDISDTLKADNLPNDFNTPIDAIQLAPYKTFPFVKQLELIDANSRTINHAISDYHRAFSQKSKWLREGLIFPSDEIEYHSKLKHDWDRKFSLISNTTDDEATQKQNGKVFYESHYVSQFPQIFIKDRFRENYMVTGCCHDLSNKKEIGWHPDFESKV